MLLSPWYRALRDRHAEHVHAGSRRRADGDRLERIAAVLAVVNKCLRHGDLSCYPFLMNVQGLKCGRSLDCTRLDGFLHPQDIVINSFRLFLVEAPESADDSRRPPDDKNRELEGSHGTGQRVYGHS